ncbi:MAG: hypothetical protein ABIN36_11485 [Ferruginibacter sp.]
MKFLNFTRLLFACTLVLGLYSCTPDQPPVIPDDKLLLTEYHTQTQYIDDGYDDYVNITYSYGPRQGNFFFNCKPIQSINFVDYGGSYNYTYENSRPATLIDNGNPGSDQGLWKFYYDNNNRIFKTGLAYQVAAEPTVFDFFDYDSRGNVEYAYRGATKETPNFYMKYLYNAANKLVGTEFYTPIPAGKEDVGQSSSALPGYRVTVTTTITSDNKRNPFHLQGSILFYHSNSGKGPFRGNFADSYIAIMDNNPLEVVYNFVLSGDVITHTFSYTYNNKKYPVSNTENISDPLYSVTGNISRTSQFAYINN